MWIAFAVCGHMHKTGYFMRVFAYGTSSVAYQLGR
nr:MAG TPA: beta-glucosidase [Caudoviricetes sp.]